MFRRGNIFTITAFCFFVISQLGWTSKFVSPEKFAAAAIIYLAFPYLAFFTFLILCTALPFIKFKRIFVCFLLLLAFQFRPFTGLHFSFLSKHTTDEDKISVMSYNVNNFGLYLEGGRLENQQQIMQKIKNYSPDIICFQDFYTRHGDDTLNNIRYLKEYLGYNYHLFSPTLTNRAGHQWGLAVFSKFPIVSHTFYDFSGGRESANTNGLQKIILDVNGRKVQLMNYHLESFHIGRYYDLRKTEKFLRFRWWTRDLPEILRLLAPAMKDKTSQAKFIAEKINSTELPVIAAGDMNNTPGSYPYRLIHQNLFDTAHRSGKLLPWTLNSFPPFLRIDYISVSSDLTTLHYAIPNLRVSDHFPVYTEVLLSPGD